MALITGSLVKVGVITGAEPIGRITIRDQNGTDTIINCASGPKFDLARMAYELGGIVEVDVLATSNPFVADKIRLI